MSRNGEGQCTLISTLHLPRYLSSSRRLSKSLRRGSLELSLRNGGMGSPSLNTTRLSAATWRMHILLELAPVCELHVCFGGNINPSLSSDPYRYILIPG
jgi:hypothetical protein